MAPSHQLHGCLELLKETLLCLLMEAMPTSSQGTPFSHLAGKVSARHKASLCTVEAEVPKEQA